ncbi:hypothetical protein [Pontibacter flavimaris]|uniref:DUF4412 domain-containing protein n=1 Tax=Pontibacter flavimaris TaxID=1797110 RepID=A0A1Q5PFK5_9BACT|nr:hypothetical protein [Pontibacter flavimaris]OKL41019.1 hypothetical protein A3841_14405 [Pontibacter flavimaris]
MKTLFTLVLLFCGTIVFAQDFQQANVLFADGKELTGLVKASSVGEKSIMYRAAEAGSKNEKISSSELSRIYFTLDSAAYEPVYLMFNGKKRKEPTWAQKLMEGPVSLYAKGSRMSFQRSGFNHNVDDISFFTKRTDEAGASMVGMYFSSGAIGINVNRTFRKLAGEYFADYPELAARIENKEFEILEIPAVVTAYNEWKTGQQN